MHYELKEQTPRAFTVIGDVKSIVPTSIGDKVISVSLQDRKIALGHQVMIDNKPFKVNEITIDFGEDGNLNYNFSVARMTKSYLFLLPMFGMDKEFFKSENLLMNVFIGDANHDGCIVLLYRFSGDKEFLKYEQKLKSLDTFIATYDPSPYLVVFVMAVPEEYKVQYDLFLDGKYSWLDPNFKNRLMSFHKFSEIGQFAQILWPSEKRRLRLEADLGVTLPEDAELLSIINKERETLDPEIYI